MTRWPAEAICAAVAPLLAGLDVEVVASIDSTNTELMRRARAGRTAPVLLVAEAQTHGRGRLGRAWHGEVGHALTFSLALPLAPRSWSGLSLAVGVAVAEALHGAGGSGIGLKWPNDLWLHGAGGDRKLGGILVETAPIGTASETDAHMVASAGLAHAPGAARQRYAVIGVGINIASPTAGTALSMPPAWLLALSPTLDAASALAAIVPALVRAVRDFEAHGFAPFQWRFAARDVLRDRAVSLSDGTVGSAHGVDEVGALLVHTARGMHAVTSSEVSVRPLATPKPPAVQRTHTA